MFSCITVLNYISMKVYWKTGFSVFGQNAWWHAVLSWRTLQYCTVYLGKQVSWPRSPERCCWTVVVRRQQLCCSCRLDVASWSWQYSRCLSAWWTTSIYTCLAYLYWWVLCDVLTSTPVKCRSTCRVGSLNPCSSTHSLQVYSGLIDYLSFTTTVFTVTAISRWSWFSQFPLGSFPSLREELLLLHPFNGLFSRIIWVSQY